MFFGNLFYYCVAVVLVFVAIRAGEWFYSRAKETYRKPVVEEQVKPTTNKPKKAVKQETKPVNKTKTVTNKKPNNKETKKTTTKTETNNKKKTEGKKAVKKKPTNRKEK